MLKVFFLPGVMFCLRNSLYTETLCTRIKLMAREIYFNLIMTFYFCSLILFGIKYFASRHVIIAQMFKYYATSTTKWRLLKWNSTENFILTSSFCVCRVSLNLIPNVKMHTRVSQLRYFGVYYIELCRIILVRCIGLSFRIYAIIINHLYYLRRIYVHLYIVWHISLGILNIYFLAYISPLWHYLLVT